MQTRRTPLSAVFTAIILAGVAAGALVVLETTPGATEAAAADDSSTVDPAYKHAPAEAYEKWHDLKYGLRIHWGYYSLVGCEASWPLVRPREPSYVDRKQEYFNLYKNFNPAEFDAEEWMDLFERCGLTFFTITAKHHDGFSMFDTKTRVKRRGNYAAPGGPRIEACDLAYSIMDAPNRRDLIKEITAAAQKRGIAVDLYFSHIDWYDADFRMDPHHPLYDKDYNKRTDPEGYARMIRRHREQIRELLTRYGKVDMMCLDMRLPDFCWPDLKETVMMARRLQPEVLLRQRGIGAYGDYQTPENWIPSTEGQKDKRPVTMPWMVIHTLSRQFAYDPDGDAYRSGEWTLEKLVDIVAKGGNFMVSIGPDGQGRFHPKAVEHLSYVGRWLKVNGEAIYKTRPFRHYKEGEGIRFTQTKDHKYVYAIALKWPGETLHLTRVRAREGAQITMLGCQKPLTWRQDATGLFVTIPDELQNPTKRSCVQAWAFRIEVEPDMPK